MAKEKTGKSVSVWNWIGTLLLAAIPVVNLIAALALEIFFLLLFAAGLVFFGEEIITWLQTVQISL